MVQEILGYKKIKLSDKNKVEINFLNQGDTFFLGKNLTAPDKAKLTGIVYGTHYGDAVLKDTNVKAKKIVAEINHYNKDIKSLDKKIDEYAYLDEFEKLINEVEEDYVKLEKMQEEIDSAKKLLKEKNDIEEELKNLNKIITTLNNSATEYLPMYEKLQKDTEFINLAKEKDVELKAILKQGVQAGKIVKALSGMNEIANSFEKLKAIGNEIVEDKNKLNQYIRLNNETIILNKQITEVDELIKKLEGIMSLKEDVERLTTLNSNISKAIEYYNEAKDIKINIDKTKEEEEKYQKQNLEYITQYKKELEKLGKCPVCNGNIDRIIVEGIITDMKNKSKHI